MPLGPLFWSLFEESLTIRPKISSPPHVLSFSPVAAVCGLLSLPYSQEVFFFSKLVNKTLESRKGREKKYLHFKFTL
jgi:hypothetical protein